MYGTVCKMLPTKTIDASVFLEGMQRQEHAGIERRAGRERGSRWLAP
jgi:formate hydrogenlyase subunit 4